MDNEEPIRVNLHALNCSGPITIGPPSKPIEAHVMEWISIKERLPEGGEWVLVIASDGDYEVAYTHDSRENLERDDFTFLTSHSCAWKVTHWMPLPDPPKEKGCIYL